MTNRKIVIPAALVISALYIPAIYDTGLLISIISYIPFIAGVFFSLKKGEILWLMIPGELLVINNHSVYSSIAIQLVLMGVFISLLIPGYLRFRLPVVSGCLIITAITGFLATEMQITTYALLILTALITGYFIVEIRWKRLKIKSEENS